MSYKTNMLIVLFIVLFLCSCSNEQEAVPQSFVTNAPTKISSEEHPYPDYFVKLVDSYNDSAKSYNLSYETPLFTAIAKAPKDSFYSYSYNFGIQSLNDPSSCVTESIYELPNGRLTKSYQVLFDDDFDAATIRDFITATLLFTNSETDYSSAVQMTNTIINSYSGLGYSDTIVSGQYYVFLKSADILGPCHKLYVMFKNEVNQPPDLSEYQLSDYEVLSSPLNSGSLVCIEARVDSVILSGSSDSLMVSDASGNSFSVFFDYSDFCIDFEVGRPYIFYGVVTRNSGIGLRYVFSPTLQNQNVDKALTPIL